MNDLISRQAAIDAIEEVDWYHQNKNKDMVSGANSSEEQAWYKADDIYKTLEALPSAQPQWIPVAERLPDEDYCTGRGIQHSESVLVTVVHHANDDDVFVDMACTVDGKWQLTYPFDDDPDIPKWCEIIAWMPLPESYSGETKSRDYENKGDDN